MRNPLVLIVACGKYEGAWANLEGPKRDLKTLFDLFVKTFEWRNVRFLHENVTKDNIWDFLAKER